jgi:hypothetical protein
MLSASCSAVAFVFSDLFCFNLAHFLFSWCSGGGVVQKPLNHRDEGIGIYTSHFSDSNLPSPGYSGHRPDFIALHGMNLG